MNRSTPFLPSPVQSETLRILGDFADLEPNLSGYAIIDSSRTENGDDIDQPALFPPTSKADIFSQGVATGAKFLVVDRFSGALDIVPPIENTAEHNRILNLAAGAASLAIQQ